MGYTKITIALALILVALGLFIPLWYVAVAGLALFSVVVPFGGIFVGFLLDVIYGAPATMPVVFAFPCTIFASVIGILALFLRTYIRS
jgi:hypothetical protein